MLAASIDLQGVQAMSFEALEQFRPVTAHRQGGYGSSKSPRGRSPRTPYAEASLIGRVIVSALNTARGSPAPDRQ